jgi:hypothetical protein
LSAQIFVDYYTPNQSDVREFLFFTGYAAKVCVKHRCRRYFAESATQVPRFFLNHPQYVSSEIYKFFADAQIIVSVLV